MRLRPRIAARTRDLIESARSRPELNKTELATLLSKKGRLPGLSDAHTPEEMWSAWDGQELPDTYLTQRLGLYWYVAAHYDAISVYMICPARVHGPTECLTCRPELLVACYLDNQDLLGKEVAVAGMNEVVLLAVALRKKFGMPTRVSIRIPMETLKQVAAAFESGDYPNLSTAEEAAAALNALPDDAEIATKGLAILEGLRYPKEGAQPPAEAAPARRGRRKRSEVPPEAQPEPAEQPKQETPPCEKTEEVATPAEAAAAPPFVVDLSKVHEFLDSLESQLARLGTQVDKLADRADLDHKLAILGDMLSAQLELLAGDSSRALRERWTSLWQAPLQPEALEALSDDELRAMAKDRLAPDTALANRATLLSWLTT